MGLFSSLSVGMRGTKAVNKIRNGGKAKISYAMVSMLIISLQEAKAKLTPDKYKAVEDLFMEFQKCSTICPNYWLCVIFANNRIYKIYVIRLIYHTEG